MENKKQLVVVPPMSEPLQKLNEVLSGIAEDENVEISLIDDHKELSQFIGSAGQCLILFSNAKKCASFLQENRFVIAKTHSKIILLTPKEIPAKTLIKFVKIGLTESVLENSPPKTLLYKVKLLLRSIKSSSPQEDKDQIVKSMLDLNQPSTTKSDIATEKDEEKKEEGLNYISEERLKHKEKNEETIDYSDNLKSKNNFHEEAIDTNWKSKRKKDGTESLDNEVEHGKVKSDDTNNIDLYYRKKKKNSYQEAEEPDLRSKKLSIENAEEEDENINKKNQLELILDSASKADKKKQRRTEEEDDLLLSKTKIQLFNLEEGDPASEKEIFLTEEEKAEAKKKEFDELEALFEAAKKKQAETAEDLGGHYKGKVGPQVELEEEEDLTEEKKEYDNSDLYQREKQFELDLIAADDEKKKKGEEDDYDEAETKGHDGQVELINSYTQSSKDGQVDKLDTNMRGEINKDISNKLSDQEIHKLAKKLKDEITEDTDDKDRSDKNKNLIDENNEDLLEEENPDYQKDNEKKRKKQTDLNLEDATVDPTGDGQDDVIEESDDNNRAKTSGLQLLDEDIERNRAEMEGPDANMAFKKLAQTDLDLEKNKEKGPHSGKVDKIDTFYRGGEAKKNLEHNWDNLTNRKQVGNDEAKKGSRREQEFAEAQLKKNAGEITIDYRQLKEEFNDMARNGTTDKITTKDIKRDQGLSDSEDGGSFKVVELDTRGFEFGIEILNLIYQKDTKVADFYKKISEELISNYKAYPLFYTYRPSDKQHLEAFNSIVQLGDSVIPPDLTEWWIEAKMDQLKLDYYFNKTMTTWLCRDLSSKSDQQGFWEDVELPSWAVNELSDKKVEMIFPYFDGIDRMGTAIVFFPQGVNAAKEKSLIIIMELARTIFLDTIQRINAPIDEEQSNEPPTEKKNILSMFSGIFNRNKAS